ncbi:MAG: dehydrogenase [Alphaproteobacteria bacterium]|nr:dehydrogenase [Alphaproteobacteria bacterium]
MSRFQVGLSSDFLRPDGSLLFREMDLALLDREPDLAWRYVGAAGAATIAPADVADLDALMLLGRRMSRESFHPNHRLALIARWGVGYDNVDTAACTANGVALTITPDGVRRPVAVSIIALILAVTGKLLIKDRLTRQDRWGEKTNYNGVGLVGRTLGSIGLGNIGSELFRLAKPFDMTFIAHDPIATPQHAASLGVRLVQLDRVFSESDIVCVNCPLSPATHHLVNAERLKLMKPTAFLINTARGPIVDQKALCAALTEGRIAGAGLDVLEQEPPDPNDPILALDNVVLAPHALCWTDQLVEALMTIDINAILAVKRGAEPAAIVNREILTSAAWRAKLADFHGRFAR